MKESNFFKEKLYHHTLPVRDDLWNAIEAQLPPKKEQRIFPAFWFLLFASAGIGGALMLGLFDSSQTTKQTIAAQEHLALIQPANTDDQENVNTNQTEPSSTPASSEASNNPTNESTNDNTSSSTFNSELSTSSSSSTLNSQPSTSSTLNPQLSTSSTSSTNHDKKSPSPSNTSLTNKTSISHSKKASPSTTNAAEISSADQDPLLIADENQQIISQVTSRSASATSMLPMDDHYLHSESDLFLIQPKVKPDPNCYKFTANGNQFAYSIDVYGAPGFSPKSFEEKSGENSVYVTAREATEQNQYAWSAGARFNVHHRSGLTGRLGFNYTRVGDVFDFTDSLATQSTTRIDSFFSADGTFLYAETSQVLVLGTLIKKIHNTYQYFDVPLIIGYEMPMGRSNLMFNLGPVFNLVTKHEGQILDPMLHPRPITDGEPGAIDVYKTNIGMSIYVGAGVLFPISDRFSGLVEPSFTYRLNPVTLDGYPISEHRHYGALNLGLRYHIQ